MIKSISSITLVMACSLAVAADFQLQVEDHAAVPVTGCGITPIVSPYTYVDADCDLMLERSADNANVSIPLGSCVGLHKLKIIIDNHMYKFNVDATHYNNLFNSEDVLAIAVPIGGCTGNSTAPSNLSFYTDTDIIPLDEEFGVLWAVDANSKPMIILKSASGNTVCNNGTLVQLNDVGDIIFEDAFE